MTRLFQTIFLKGIKSLTYQRIHEERDTGNGIPLSLLAKDLTYFAQTVTIPVISSNKLIRGLKIGDAHFLCIP